MHIAICDDNIQELVSICTMLDRYGSERNSSVTYESFYSAAELLQATKERQFDMLLLDILMPGLTGMDAAFAVRETNSKIPIIFLTSSPEYAVASYRVSAEDYIMKPARQDEIYLALDKQVAKFTRTEPYVTLKMTNGLARVPLSHIVMVEVANHSVSFTLVGGQTREVYGQLAEYEKELLPYPMFYKPHRSFLVNLRQVSTMSKDCFVTTTGRNIPISRDSLIRAKAAYTKAMLSDKGDF